MKLNAVFSTIRWVAFCGLLDATLVSTSIAAPDDQAAVKEVIRQHEKAALEAFRTHDKITYAKLCCEEFYEITSGGTINTLQAELQELDDYVLGEYRMDDVLVTILSDSVALIRYKVFAKYTYQGKELPAENMLASAVWIKRGDDWKSATYQEVKLPDAR
jgi:hypothetical protein